MTKLLKDLLAKCEKESQEVFSLEAELICLDNEQQRRAKCHQIFDRLMTCTQNWAQYFMVYEQWAREHLCGQELENGHDP